MEYILDWLEQVFPVIDLDIEFAFNSIVDQNASLDVHVVVLVIPVGFESHRDTVPAVRVGMAQSVPADFDDALG